MIGDITNNPLFSSQLSVVMAERTPVLCYIIQCICGSLSKEVKAGLSAGVQCQMDCTKERGRLPKG